MAPVTPLCDISISQVAFSSSAADGQLVTVPSGCPLSVSVILSDALNNTVVSSVADVAVQSMLSTGACAGGDTSALLSTGVATVILSVTGNTGSSVVVAMNARSQLSLSSTTTVSLNSGTITFIVGNCTLGTGRTGSPISPTPANACSFATQLSCSPCNFGTYSLLSSNEPCRLLNSANAVSARNLVCALPGYWVLADNATGAVAVYSCAPGLCTGACVAQNSTDAVNASLFGLHCDAVGNSIPAAREGQVTGYCSGAVGCKNGYGGFVCGRARMAMHFGTMNA